MDGMIMTAQLLLSLSILIVVHEGGHFLAARMFKIKV
jgi:regulator of sigma E protease